MRVRDLLMPIKKLLWSQDFRIQTPATAIDNFWTYEIGDGTEAGIPGWGNNELEYYTRENLELTPEIGMVITAKKVPTDTPIQSYMGPAQWSSAKIHTGNKLSFRYGYLEFSARTPKGVGTWPALWLLGTSLLTGTPWPECGEIDLFEGVGRSPNQVQGTIHGPEYSGEFGLTRFFDHSDPLFQNFHRYAIEWQPDRIEWFFDGLSYQVIERSDPRLKGKHWPFNNRFYLIMNLAMGGNLGGSINIDLEAAELVIEKINFYSIDGLGEVFYN
jgi:beta-glucanase (GH16 family)